MYGRSAETTAVQWEPALREVVIDHINEALAHNARSVTISLEETDALRVVESWRNLGDLFYWSERNGGEVMVGAEAARIETWREPLDSVAFGQHLAQIEEQIEVGDRYFGGFRFDTLAPKHGAEWTSFGTYRFVLPRFLFKSTGETSYLTIRLDDPVDLFASIDRWQFNPPEKSHLHGIARTETRPSHQEWLSAVQRVLNEIRDDGVEKIVLARAAEVVTQGRVEMLDLFRHLVKGARSCYHVFYEPEPGTSFLSATPERLLKRDGDRLVTEAVAGTRPRSTSVQDDERLRDELFSSDKERREHEVVGRSIIDALNQFCERVEIDEQPSEMRLATGRHLKSRIEGALRPGTLTADLVAQLHPTPAVGGYPFEYARLSIRDKETFDRGWYAGGIGWLGKEEAEFAVGIRSALVDDGEIQLYSGAGIVDGSVPEKEWQEIEHKLSGFLDIFDSMMLNDG